MELKIKYGDVKIKLTSEDFFKKISSENPLENVIFKSNLEFFHKFLENMPQYINIYYKEFRKVMEKYLDISRGGTGTIPDGPNVFAANGHDIFNYISRYGTGNFHCQAIMKMDKKLDLGRLVNAIKLSIEAEPVFGCRFVESNPPYWKRIENINDLNLCTFEEVTDINQAVQSFLESPLDMDNDPMIKIKLIRTDSYDVLGIKANHACCDGTGIKEYIQLLADIYTNTDNQKDVIRSKKVRGRADQDRLFENLGITDTDSMWIPGSDIYIPTWSFPWIQDTSNVTRVVMAKIPSDQLQRMSIYAKSKGATINDLLVTAYYRAMLKMGQPVYGVPMSVNVTVDLRRYLPDHKTEAIRNFSGSVNTWLPMKKDETFNDTLSRVIYMMREVKEGYPGLQSAIGLERLEKINFSDTLSYYQATSKIGQKMPHCPAFYGNRCVPALSNLAVLSSSCIMFDDANVIDYYVIPPVISPPGILLVANTYNNVMTLAAGFFENTVLYNDIQRLVYSIRDELLEGCTE